MDGPENSDAMLSAALSANAGPVLGIRLGRGRTGGSTFLDFLIQRARTAGRKVVIADGDIRNSTLAALYPPEQAGGALKPKSEDLEDMKELFSRALDQATEEGSSLLVDFGGGDRVMLEYGRETNLIQMAESLGMQPLAIYVTGPERDDFEHIVSLWRSKVFRPERAVLVLNDFLIPNGRSPEGAFRDIIARTEFIEMTEQGLETVVMPRLPCMALIRQEELTLRDAMIGRPGKRGTPIGPVRQFMVKTWVERIEGAFAEQGLLNWLP
jgi:hypothetical protein